jgi:hypothetical protein
MTTSERSEDTMTNTTNMLDAATCDQLVPGLVRVLTHGEPIAPSETIELVDAVIGYCTAVDEISGSTTPGLDDLIDARANYSGPGVRR